MCLLVGVVVINLQSCRVTLVQLQLQLKLVLVAETAVTPFSILIAICDMASIAITGSTCTTGSPLWMRHVSNGREDEAQIPDGSTHVVCNILSPDSQ